MATLHVCEMALFDAAFPEAFQAWEFIDQRSLSTVAQLLVRAVRQDLQTASRANVAGLRHALRLIAGEATITPPEESQP